MKNRVLFIVLALVLIALIGAAAVVYPKLSEQMTQAETTVVETTEAQKAPEITDQLEATAAPVVTTAPTEVPQTEAQATAAPEMIGPVRRYMATDFTVYDDAGNTVSLSGFKGKPVVVNFFASWCGPCKYEMPYFEEFYQQYGDQVEFMMVNLCAFGNDTKEAAKKMVAEGAYTFPVYFDSDGDAAIKYSVRSMPMTIFVSSEGELKGQKIGMLDRETLKKTVEAMAAETK